MDWAISFYWVIPKSWKIGEIGEGPPAITVAPPEYIIDTRLIVSLLITHMWAWLVNFFFWHEIVASFSYYSSLAM